MPENQVPAHSAASGADDSRPATMGDIRHLENALQGSITQLRGDMRADMNHMETSLRGEMNHMETSLRGEMAEMRGDLREVRNGQWKIITLAIVGLPVMLEVVPMIFDLLRG